MVLPSAFRFLKQRGKIKFRFGENFDGAAFPCCRPPPFGFRPGEPCAGSEAAAEEEAGAIGRPRASRRWGAGLGAASRGAGWPGAGGSSWPPPPACALLAPRLPLATPRAGYFYAV